MNIDYCIFVFLYIDSPRPCSSVTSLTPNRLDITPKSIQTDKPPTPASLTTPTLVATTSSRIGEGRTPKSSRLFMETWLKSPGSPGSVTQARRTSARKQNATCKDTKELEQKTKLSVIEETSEPSQNSSEDIRIVSSKTDCPMQCSSSRSTEKKVSPSECKNSPSIENTGVKAKKKELRVTPQRATKSGRRGKKLLTPKSESIKTFLIPTKRKRCDEDEDDEKFIATTRQVAKCLKMEKTEEGKENSLVDTSTMKILDNELLTDVNEQKVVLSENCRTPTRIKDLLDLADDAY